MKTALALLTLFLVLAQPWGNLHSQENELSRFLDLTVDGTEIEVISGSYRIQVTENTSVGITAPERSGRCTLSYADQSGLLFYHQLLNAPALCHKLNSSLNKAVENGLDVQLSADLVVGTFIELAIIEEGEVLQRIDLNSGRRTFLR